MAHSLPHKFVSLLLLAVVIAASVAGLCRETHAAEQCWGGHGDRETAASSLAVQADQCPSCPADEQSHHNDCDSSCYCSCHLPLTIHFAGHNYAPPVSRLVSYDAFFRFPEVFLSKFVPPQILA